MTQAGAGVDIPGPVDPTAVPAENPARSGSDHPASGVDATEMRYRILSHAVAQTVLALDLEGRHRYVSPACLGLLGVGPAELIGTPLRDRVHDEDAPILCEVLAELGRGLRDEAVTTFRQRHRDKGWIWVEASWRLVREPGGVPAEIVASVRDVSERIQTERIHAESEVRYRALADSLPHLVWVMRASDGAVVYANQHFRSYYGPTAPFMTGWTVNVHADDVGRVVGRWAAAAREGQVSEAEQVSEPGQVSEAGQVFEEGRAFEEEARLARQDGIYLWHKLIMVPIRQDGQVAGWLGTAHNIDEIITGRRQLQETTRLLQLAQAAAEEARHEAVQASEAKSDFLAAMSHEIRTPLNSIIGYTDLLLADRTLSPQQHRYVTRLQSAGSALLTVVDDILDFSTIDAGQVTLDVATFSLRSMIDDVMSIMHGIASTKSLRLVHSLQWGVPDFMVGDVSRLRQILLNLMNNGVKFTHEGSVTLSVGHSRRGTENRLLRFEVADTGIGIPLDKQDRLFQRFSQMDGSIRRRFGGTGLGLAISKRLVEIMNGQIGVTSREGQGSTFWFEVALPEGTAEDVVSGAALPEHAPAPSPSAHVLVVEDVEVNRDLVRLVLETYGHRVDVAADGAEAVAAVERGSYDLVLMDIEMPVMDGITAARTIRNLPGAGRDVPIVAMTANVLPRQIQTFREAGMNDHLGKPFKQAALVDILRRWTNRADPAAVHGPDAAAFDDDVLASLRALIGAEKTGLLLGKLAERLRTSFSGDLAAKDRTVLRIDAHNMISAAGLLGFQRLSVLSDALARACTTEECLETLARDIAAARDDAIAEITRLEARTSG